VDALFQRLAARTADVVGSAWTFMIAVAIVVGWALTGPLFHFSDTWQLTINTTASIVPSLMVFLIQNTQNRDAKAVHLKLDELLRANATARNSFIQLEEMSDADLDRLEAEFRRIRGGRRGDGGAAAHI
jgi:low affinity Fe/Cu permease